MTEAADRLYSLLPAVFRVRDADQGFVLRELVSVIADQVAVLEDELEQLYDDQFIETCAEWVAPYIGELVGYRTLYGVVPSVASPRAEVANTIGYRRRKGTAAVLEQLARDVTGWPAGAVEFFQRLATTQYMNHVRPSARAMADLRDEVRLGWLGGPFDDMAHTADVRRIAAGAGRYNIPNVGIFLWRVRAFPLTRSPLVAADAGRRRFRLDPLGADRQLFGLPRTEEEITHLAEPFDVPIALGRRWLAANLTSYYGAGRSLLLELDDGSSVVPIEPSDVRVCDLSDVASSGAWAHEPRPGDLRVSIDPVLGRVYFRDPLGSTDRALGSFHYGGTMAAWGGEYERAAVLPPAITRRTIAAGAALQPALDAVKRGGVVEILDSESYRQTPVVRATAASAESAARSVILRAANGSRPLVVANGPVRINMAPHTRVVIDGLIVAGGAIVIDEVADSMPRDLVLRHCTLVPGGTLHADGSPVDAGLASLIVLHPFARVTIDRCVLGPIVAVAGAEIDIRDSIVDATDLEAIAFAGRPTLASGDPRVVTSPAHLRVGDGLAAGGALTIAASTVIGRVHAERLEASDCIAVATPPQPDPWKGPVWIERRQEGCARFSYLPAGSLTPSRYRCQPTDDSIRPHFSSLRYGDPDYCQLRPLTPDAIRRGASDESEMGGLHSLYQPQRETNLRIRLDEYLRFGLEAGIFYAT